MNEELNRAAILCALERGAKRAGDVKCPGEREGPVGELFGEVGRGDGGEQDQRRDRTLILLRLVDADELHIRAVRRHLVELLLAAEIVKPERTCSGRGNETDDRREGASESDKLHC